ncbi:MAG: hypothetical protein M3Q29_22940 [Chloroflexota bacterium]|nr:hypothetical protein [Chloroflexota bacterium]
MRLVGLYLKSRRASRSVTCLAGVAGLGWLIARWLLSQPGASAEGGIPLILLLVLPPLYASVIIGVSSHSPFGDVERSSGRWLPALRLGHLVGLLALGAAGLSLAALRWDLAHAEWTLARNMLGLAGLALLCALVTGSKLSWIAPLAFGAAALLTGLGPDGEPLRWAWLLHAGPDSLAVGMALGLAAAGLGIVGFYGTAEMAGEAE